jgi:flagella basal body P-ring formation protein FlgA
MEDLSVRLGLPREQLEVSFNPKDESLLNFSEPLFKFNLTARNVRDLGQVSWDVLILNGSSSQKGVITAMARAWQTQAVVAKPLAYHQVIRLGDITERRELVDRLPDEQLLTIDQAVGQEAARELKVGIIIGARMIDPVPLVKAGQLVTITLTQGTVRVKTIGRALESGAYGQAVRVRNDATRDIFEVVMTGPQEGSIGPLPDGAKAARVK